MKCVDARGQLYKLKLFKPPYVYTDVIETAVNWSITSSRWSLTEPQETNINDISTIILKMIFLEVESILKPHFNIPPFRVKANCSIRHNCVNLSAHSLSLNALCIRYSKHQIINPRIITVAIFHSGLVVNSRYKSFTWIHVINMFEKSSNY